MHHRYTSYYYVRGCEPRKQFFSCSYQNNCYAACTYVCTARTTRAGIRREEHVAWRRTGRARLRRTRNNVTRMVTYPQKASRPLILQFNSSTKKSYKYVSIIFTHQLVSFLASSFSAINVNLINQLIKQFVELSLILFTS